ncbi:MAG: hypothetical protein EKK41_10605 [Hyphomicrobiales bacterium]|nr:MAG: hypothetical protein EKK41_10605 [Hyphomicrobiales bacterium]
MPPSIHPAAQQHLPSFITAPGEIDVLMVAMGIFSVIAFLMFGVLLLRLHALPDQMAHKKIQYEIVCVLGLVSLFTHMQIFWVAGLLLALIDLPDFSYLKRIVTSVEKMAGVSNEVQQTNEVAERSPEAWEATMNAANLPVLGEKQSPKEREGTRAAHEEDSQRHSGQNKFSLNRYGSR